MDDLLTSAKALLDIVRQYDDSNGGITEYAASELCSLAKAVEDTEECIRHCGEVSVRLGE